GGSGNVNLVSTNAFVLGIPSLSAANYQIVSSNTAIDGSIVAGGTVNIQGAAIMVLNVTANGAVTMKANGFVTTPYQGPLVIGIEPDLLNAVTNLWNVQAAPNGPNALSLFNAAGGYFNHGTNYSLASAPLQFTNLTKTLTEVMAGLLTLSPTAP